jgi:hypothetical protein
MDDKMRKKLLELRELVWGEDIPSPVCPEYIEHHESIQKILKTYETGNRYVMFVCEHNGKDIYELKYNIKENLWYLYKK